MNQGGEGTQTSESSNGASPMDWNDLDSISNHFKSSDEDVDETEIDAGDEEESDPESLEPGPDDGKEEPPEPTEELDKDQEAKPKEKEPRPKFYKAKLNGKASKVSAYDEIEMKVDGEIKQIKVQALVDDFNGKVAIEKRLGEIDTQKKTFQTERATFEKERSDINESIGTLHKLAVKEGKPLEAIGFLAEMLGGNAADILEEVEDQLFESAKAALEESPEARKIRRLERRNGLIEQKAKAQESKVKEQQRNSAIETQVTQTIKQHQMTEDEFLKAYGELKSHFQSQKIPLSELTPDIVGEMFARDRVRLGLSEVVKNNGWETPQGEIGKALYEEWLRDRTLTIKDLEAIGAQVFGVKKVIVKKGEAKKPIPPAPSKLKEKIERSQGAKFTGSQTAKKDKFSEATFFDDL